MPAGLDEYFGRANEYRSSSIRGLVVQFQYNFGIRSSEANRRSLAATTPIVLRTESDTLQTGRATPVAK